MSWHNTAKFRRSAAEVNEAVGWRRTVFLPGEISSTGGVLRHTAPSSAMAAVRGEKSAEAIVVEETSRSAQKHSKVAGGLPPLRSGHAEERFPPPETGGGGAFTR